MIACISLHQPYASLIAARMKVHETRGFAAPQHLVGHRIAIHAAARPMKPMENGLGMAQLCRVTFGAEWDRFLPLGAIVCTALLDGQRLTQDTTPIGVADRLAGDWTPGRWAWLLRDTQRLDVPLPMLGRQRWWYVDEALLAA